MQKKVQILFLWKALRNKLLHGASYYLGVAVILRIDVSKVFVLLRCNFHIEFSGLLNHEKWKKKIQFQCNFVRIPSSGYVIKLHLHVFNRHQRHQESAAEESDSLFKKNELRSPDTEDALTAVVALDEVWYWWYYVFVQGLVVVHSSRPECGAYWFCSGMILIPKRCAN